MSWLSTSLSENLTNITGQISTFTKDMLTEGAVEVQDPESELRVAKSRLRELELTLYTQKEEYDRVKELNHELQERAEAAELQITSISREYRTIIQEKEDEIVELREVHTKGDDSLFEKERERLPSFNEDSFVNGASSEEQIAYLKSVISKLQTEKQEWNKKNEMELSLHKEVDHYQHELATLHSTYSQRIAALNKNHKEEMERLENTLEDHEAIIDELTKKLDNSKDEVSLLKEALEEYKRKLRKFEEDIRTSEENIMKTTSNLSECDTGSSDYELINDKSSNENQGIHTLESNSELKILIEKLEHEKQVVVDERDHAILSEQQMSSSLESLKEELSRLAMVTMELMKELEQSQGVDTEKTIEIESLKKLCLQKKEGNKDDILKYKEMLTMLWKKYGDVVLENKKVRIELNKVKQRLLSQIQDRHSDTRNVIQDISGARVKLEGTLEGQREQITGEKNHYESILPDVSDIIIKQEETVSNLEEENRETTKNTKDILSELGKVWGTDNHSVSSQEEKIILEQTIVGLEAKVEKLEELLRDNNHLSKQCTIEEENNDGTLVNEQLKKLQELQGTMTGLEAKNAKLEELLRDNNHFNNQCIVDENDDVVIEQLQEKVRKYEETMTEYDIIREDWENEKEALENVLIDLRKRLKDALSTTHKVDDSELEEQVVDKLQEMLLRKQFIEQQDIPGLARVNYVLTGALQYITSIEDIVIEKDMQQVMFSGQQATAMDEGRNDDDSYCEADNYVENTINDSSETMKELKDTRNELTQARNALLETKNMFEKLKDEFDLTKMELEGAIDERKTFEDKVKFLEAELECSNVSITSAVSEKNNEVLKLRNVVEELQERLASFENDKNTEVSRLEENITSLEKELEETKGLCEQLKHEVETKCSELASVIVEKASLENKITDLYLEQEKFVVMVNDRDGRIGELQDLYDSVEQRVTATQEHQQQSEKAYNEIYDQCSVLKQEKTELFNLLEGKDASLNQSIRENEQLSQLLRQQQEASDVIRVQNEQMTRDLGQRELQIVELREVNETLSHEVDGKLEEILSLKENNIELMNQSYDRSQRDDQVSRKLNQVEDLRSENEALKCEKVLLTEEIARNEVSKKDLQESYHVLLREKEQFELSLSEGMDANEKEVNKKQQEIEVLRLDVGRLSREVQEKEAIIRAEVSSNIINVGNDQGRQEHIRRVLEEKDVEMTALRTKNESLLTLFAENEEMISQLKDDHDTQLRSMLERQERMLNEINDKTDQIVALEDQLDIMAVKCSSKDQATALIHAEHQKLLRLNESQAEEIGKLREKASTLGVLVAERDHGKENELKRMRQRNIDLQSQIHGLQGEQERLLTLVHEKDQQLSIIINEVPLTRSEVTNITETTPAIDNNEILTNEIGVLRAEVTSLTETLGNERKMKNEMINKITQLKTIETDLVQSRDEINNLQDLIKKLKESLTSKERELDANKEKYLRENDQKSYEITRLRSEKEEVLNEQTAQLDEFNQKLKSIINVIFESLNVNDIDLTGSQDFQKLLNKLRHHRNKSISEKNNEITLLRDQLHTISSVQNISNTELDRKIEEFIKEKDEMNQRISEVENDKMRLQEEKENEIDQLQTQIIDISNVLKHKEHTWYIEKENMDQRSVLLDQQITSLQQDKLLSEQIKKELESEVTKLRHEITRLQQDNSRVKVLNEANDRVSKLEVELESYKDKYSKSLKEIENLAKRLDEAKQLTKNFEEKKEKELERLRTHLLQVEESYTQEALVSEEREKELRTNLERIQEQLLSSSHSLQDSNRVASLKVDQLQDELSTMTADRDDTLVQLEQAQEQSMQYMRSLENLQMVLEQFQREKESELRISREKNKEQLNEAQNEISRLQHREDELKQLLENASDALNKADKMGEGIRSKEDEIESLKQTVASLESDLQSTYEKLRRLSSNSEGKIEKSLMKNMLLAYFNTAEQKRSEVVAVLGHILNFSDDEINKVGSGSHPPHSSGWFSGLLSYGGSQDSSHRHDKTFSELFVSFLEKESENQLSSLLQTTPLSTRNIATTTTTSRGSLNTTPLATSTPYSAIKPTTQPPLSTPRTYNEDKARPQPQTDGNALLGSSIRPSLDLPTITNSSSSSNALRQILFNN